MHKGRLEAFSDGVIAIIITIMVLELKTPEGHELSALTPLFPVFISYAVSFVMVGIYWNNHHHVFQSVKEVNGKVLWANLHWLFWLSLFPFLNGWIGESNFATTPVALYGVVLFAAAISYGILIRALIAHHGEKSALAIALNKDRKSLASRIIYLLGIVLTFVHPWLGFAAYVLVAILWFIPDQRIERALSSTKI